MLDSVGFWFNELAPSRYPRPQALVGSWKARERTRVLAALRRGVPFASYRARSFCRFTCGERQMGHRDLTDGQFVWPEGLAHYVEHHAVQLPDWFRIAAIPVLRRDRVDDTRWIAWARTHGAVVALDGWEVPGLRAQQTIARALERRVKPGHPLWGQSPEIALAGQGAAVLRLAAGLAVVELATGETRLLGGWEDLEPRRAS